MKDIKEIKAHVSDIVETVQEESATERSTELRQQLAALLGSVSTDMGRLYRQVQDLVLEIRDARPGAYARIACEETTALESDNPEVTAALAAFTKSAEEDDIDKRAFDDNNGTLEGPIGDVLDTILTLENHAQKTAAFVADQTAVTPDSHAANAAAHMQQGAGHLITYSQQL